MTQQRPEIRPGTLRDFDAGSYRAAVQLTGSLAQWLADVPVSRGLPSGEMTVGRSVAVAFFDPSNPSDAVVFAVWD
jgi:hypothetical protein